MKNMLDTEILFVKPHYDPCHENRDTMYHAVIPAPLRPIVEAHLESAFGATADIRLDDLRALIESDFEPLGVQVVFNELGLWLQLNIPSNAPNVIWCERPISTQNVIGNIAETLETQKGLADIAQRLSTPNVNAETTARWLTQGIPVDVIKQLFVIRKLAFEV